MIDFHCHILPGIDDGARDVVEALEMARLLAAAGFRETYCTPHCIRGSYDTTPQQVRAAAGSLQQDLRGAGIGLRLWPGMEYYLDEYFLDLDELQPLGDSRLVLLEAPGQSNPAVVKAGLERVLSRGLTPLIAHPERSEIFVAAAGNARQTVELPPGCLLQANVGSFTGFYGPRVQRSAYDLLRTGGYAAIGSDAHDAGRLAGVLEAWRGKLVVNPALLLLADAWKSVVPGEGAHS